MKRNKSFNLNLPSVDADISSSLCICPDMMGIEQFDVGIGKPVWDEKIKAFLACSIRLSCIGVASIFLKSSRLIYRCLGAGFFSYSTYDFLVHGKIHVSVQPTQVAVGMCDTQVLGIFQISLERFAELFRVLFKKNVHLFV